MVDVSVVICTLHRPESLERTVRALAEGTRLPAEVIVADQSRRLWPSVERDQIAHGLNVLHLPLFSNGLSRAQNAGVAAASRSICAITDDDCVPDRRWIEVIQQNFGSRDGLGLLTGRVLPLPAEGDRTVAVSSRTDIRERTLRRDTLPWHMGTGGNFAVLRDAYLAVGGNDERLGSGTPAGAGNDLDLFYRLVRRGVAATYDPLLLVEHRRSTPQERRSRRHTYGRGFGHAIRLWLLQRDTHAGVVLWHWMLMRLRRSAHALARGRLDDAVDEMRVLVGTATGLARNPR